MHLLKPEKTSNENKVDRSDMLHTFRRPVPAHLWEPGALVLLKLHQVSDKSVSAKLLPKHNGPYKILRAVTTTTYEIEHQDQPGASLTKVHSTELTPYVGGSDIEPGAALVTQCKKRERPRKNTATAASPKPGCSFEPEGEHVTVRPWPRLSTNQGVCPQYTQCGRQLVFNRHDAVKTGSFSNKMLFL